MAKNDACNWKKHKQKVALVARKACCKKRPQLGNGLAGGPACDKEEVVITEGARYDNAC